MELSNFREWLLQKKLVSKSTAESYASMIPSFAEWLEGTYGEKEVSAATAFDIEEYKTYLLKVKNRAASTVNQRLAALKSYFSYLQDKGVREDNPTLQVEAAADLTKRQAPDTLNDLEFKRFRREVHARNNLRDIAIVEMLYGTGMRISELADVELNHINLGDRKGSVRIVGKGKKERTVPLPLRTRKALAAYLEVRPDMKTDKLFLGQRGELSRTGIYKIIKKYADRVGLSDKVHPHTLRHQFATTLLREKQVDISLLADMMGHESLETTRVYTMPSYADKEAALEDL